MPKTKRRVKEYRLPFDAKRQLVISLRRFRTKESRRSKRFIQYVYPVKFFSYRELALALKNRPRPRRPAPQPIRSPLTLLRQAAMPTLLFLAGVTGLAYSIPHLQQPAQLDLLTNNRASAAPVIPAPLKTKTLPRSLPMRIRIPKINVDTVVGVVGQKTDGTIQMPSDFWATGWYDHSPTPGQLGPAIIVGHVDQVKGIAIFWRLRELVPGDRIDISRHDSSAAHFIVTAIRQFPQNKFPTQEVYGNINYAGIRLITCGGTFSTTTDHYSHDTVVYGKLL